VRHSPGEHAEALHFLVLAHVFFQVPALPAQLGFPQLALHSRSQPPQLVLHDVIVRALAHGADRRVFDDRGRNDQKRNIQVSFTNDVQGFSQRELRHGKIRHNHVPGKTIERFLHGLAVVHAMGNHLKSATLERQLYQFGVVRRILDEKCS